MLYVADKGTFQQGSGFLSEGTVTRMGLDASSPEVLGTGQADPGSIAVAGESVFWLERGYDGVGALWQYSPACGPAFARLTGLPYPKELATDGERLYITFYRMNTASGGAVLELPIAGGPTKMLAIDQGQPAGIAVNASHVYWANQSSKSVIFAKKD